MSGKSTMHKESFVRWQGITITQLGYVINLILTFGTAALGFALTLIKDKDFAPQNFAKRLLSGSIALLLVSIIFGIVCVVNRLADFRKTTRIARDREQWKRDGLSDTEIDNQLNSRRQTTKTLGKITWWLFWLQIGAFAFGVLSLSSALMVYYRDKLF